MKLLRTSGFVVSVFLGAGISFALADEVQAPEKAITVAEKQMGSMNRVLVKYLKEVQKAREENDIQRLNCLLTKLNLIRGLYKASERAKGVLLEASINNDQDTTKNYKDKIDSYHEGVMGLDRSIVECLGIRGGDDAVTIAYIRPEGAPEMPVEDQSPWVSDSYSGSEGYPAVPPASPYR